MPNKDYPGILISPSGCSFGAALNPKTLLAKKNGSITGNYPVKFRGISFLDANSAYLHFSRKEKSDALMQQITIAKFQQHPRFIETIDFFGGSDWLKRCTCLDNPQLINYLVNAYEQIKTEAKSQGS